MRTITALAMALTMLFAVTNAANATTHKKKHHAAQGSKKDTTKEAAPAKDKAPATK
jgi:hypothetical protein